MTTQISPNSPVVINGDASIGVNINGNLFVTGSADFFGRNDIGAHSNITVLQNATLQSDFIFSQV